MTQRHTPVLLHEAVEALQVRPDAWYIDATFGRGGHTEAVLKAGGNVIAFDWDTEAQEFAAEYFKSQIAEQKLIMLHSSFAELKAAVTKLHQDNLIGEITGILFDFGTSTHQLLSGERGFSFLEDGPLDMRMDTRLGVTAADLLAVIPEKQLAELFIEFGGEHDAKRIAKAIKQAGTVTTTKQLADLVKAVKRQHKPGMHPATKVFQALRIAVNSELDEIKLALPQALSVLAPAGRIVTIAFHEGEDALAKHAMREWESRKAGEIITKKPITPSETEVAENSRARSAKLRIFQKHDNT